MEKVFTFPNLINYKKSRVALRKGWFYGIILFSILLGANQKGFSQSGNWSVDFTTPKVFIENLGQFQIPGSSDAVQFAFDGVKTRIYFSKKGVSYYFLNKWKKEKGEDEAEEMRKHKVTSAEEWRAMEMEERKLEVKQDLVNMNWENSNPDVEIIASDVTPDYYSYSYKVKDGTEKHVNHVKAYKKILYKNLYPGIDVEYVFHPEDGLKYSLILHPGADISKVKMVYSDKIKIDKDGNVHIHTAFGDIIDHAPKTFHAENQSEIISSSFVQDGKSISFHLNNYDNSKTIVIDPWTVGPTNLPGSNAVWECARDAAGNVYLIGGETPLKLQKYNSAGVIQWTYNTPYDTSNGGMWLGTFVTDLAGNSYVTNGSSAKIVKVNTTGGVMWSANGGGMDEYWNIAFNCDQTSLVVGGTRIPNGYIFYINTANGSVLSALNVGAGNLFSFPPKLPEVRSITACHNSRYYYLCLDTLGCIDDNYNPCGGLSPQIFKINHGLNFAYKCENFRPNNGNGGIMAIRANANFAYTQNGSIIQQRSLANGAVINTAPIPGGSTISGFGGNQAGNCGIDIDSCGNVYVGSSNGVYEFDANLNLITSIATAYKVYSINVSTNGDVVFCGATGTCNTNGNRAGKIQSTNIFAACSPNLMSCCNTNICPVNPICDTMPAFNLSSSQAGGVFSGNGIIDANLGTFDPATAGAGVHTISYTLSCGVGTLDISVLHCGAPCPQFTFNISTTPACIGSTNGTATVTTSVGTAPFVYQIIDSAGGIDTYVNVVGAQTMSNLHSGTYTLVVLDANNCVDSTTITIGTSTNLTPTITGPATICLGTTATLDAGVYATYLWSTNDVTQTLLINAAGTYLVTVTDAGGCTGSATITVAQSNSLTPAITGILTICPGVSTTLDAGAGYNQYSWSTGGNTQTISVSSGGTYSVTVSNAAGCTGTTSATVVSIASLPVTASAVPQSICPGNPVTLTATGGQSYVWNTTPPSTDSVFIVNPQTTTTYMVTATYSGCTNVASVTVIVNSTLNVTASSTNAGCASDNGTVTAENPGSGCTYIWNTNPPQNSQTATGLAAGNYSVTVDCNGCSGSTTVAVIKDPEPIAGFYTKPDIIILNGSPVSFYDQSVGNISQWLWDFGDGTNGWGNQVNHVYSDTGNFNITLIIIDPQGCTDTAHGTIHIYPDFVLWIPNCFTPNGDHDNPVFKPVGVGIDPANYSMVIYDRWGREFFSTKDINEGWNGTYMNKYERVKSVEGTYVYLINVKGLNKKKYKYKGIVTLIY